MKSFDINIKSSILWQLQYIAKSSANAKFAAAALTETQKV